jgi:hypothetical protein
MRADARYEVREGGLAELFAGPVPPRPFSGVVVMSRSYWEAVTVGLPAGCSVSR